MNWWPKKGFSAGDPFPSLRHHPITVSLIDRSGACPTNIAKSWNDSTRKQGDVCGHPIICRNHKLCLRLLFPRLWFMKVVDRVYVTSRPRRWHNDRRPYARLSHTELLLWSCVTACVFTTKVYLFFFLPTLVGKLRTFSVPFPSRQLRVVA